MIGILGSSISLGSPNWCWVEILFSALKICSIRDMKEFAHRITALFPLSLSNWCIALVRRRACKFEKRSLSLFFARLVILQNQSGGLVTSISSLVDVLVALCTTVVFLFSPRCVPPSLPVLSVIVAARKTHVLGKCFPASGCEARLEEVASPRHRNVTSSDFRATITSPLAILSSSGAADTPLVLGVRF